MWRAVLLSGEAGREHHDDMSRHVIPEHVIWPSSGENQSPKFKGPNASELGGILLTFIRELIIMSP